MQLGTILDRIARTCIRPVSKIVATRLDHRYKPTSKESNRPERFACQTFPRTTFPLKSVNAEQSQGKRIPLGNAARVIGMHVIAAIINWEQSRRLARVAQNGVKIGDAIEFISTANPVVDLLADALLCGSVKGNWRRN
jgi:hypothetical protein